MVDDKNYIEYKRLKEGLNISYKGYDLKYPMSGDFAFYVFRLRKDIVNRDFIEACLIYDIDLSLLKVSLEKEVVIFTNGLPGADHQSLVQSIMDKLDHPVFFKDNSYKRKKLNLPLFLVSFFQVFFK